MKKQYIKCREKTAKKRNNMYNLAFFDNNRQKYVLYIIY